MVGKIKRHGPSVASPHMHSTRHETFFAPLPCAGLPGNRAAANGDAGAALILLLSAFGFFFSRLLRNWPFATSPS
jgi:hypothetical protein